MKIYTGNFANVKKYEKINLFPVSIAISARYFNGARYNKLNPKREFMHEKEDKYIPKFQNEILGRLNAKDVVNELCQMSGGQDIVLLCHEKEGDFCHRTLVAEWLNKKLGITVEELGKMDKKQKIHQKELF